MNLSYRGATYRYAPPTVEQLESDLVGRYRGHRVRFSYPRHLQTSHTAATLSYRGVPYRTGESSADQAAQPAPRATRPLQDLLAFRSRAAQTQRGAVMQELASVHHQNLYQLLEHRIQVARDSGNQQLVDQLEQERRQMA
ncbi:MAG: DUF4278 domain-containing protein [Cyanobacteria bacterium P01_A01_bin.135]